MRWLNSRGRVVIENGEHLGKAGNGQFLKRGTRREYLISKQ
ncbi:MAG: hypothetical protein ACR2MG_03635 [Pyrinomonadaceae bacterium]